MSEKKASTKLTRHQYLIALLCGLGYTGTCGMCYFASMYYSVYQTATGFNDTQMGKILSIIGAFAIVSYLLGGVLADMVQPKWCLLFCYISSSALGLAMLTFPGYSVMLFITGALGVTCLLPKWCPMSKLLTLSGTPEQVGRLWGWFTAFAGASTFLVGLIASAIMARTDARTGFVAMVIMYVIVLLSSAVMVLLLLKTEKGKLQSTNSFKFSYIVKLLMDPKQWLGWFTFIGMYIAYFAFTYINPMLQNVFLLPVAALTLITTIRANAVKTVMAPISGTMADKFGTLKVYRVCYIIFAAGLGLLCLIPWNSGSMVLAVVALFVIAIAYTSSYAISGPILTDIETKNEYRGTAQGFQSVAATIPDLFIYSLAGNWLTERGDIGGYKSIFTMVFVFMAVGFISNEILLAMKRKKAKIAAE